MKKYLNKIRSILTINDDAIEYIEKDTKKVAKKTYKIIKNIGILIMALIFGYILIYVRLEGIVTYFESNKELNFSITKEGIEFDQGPKDKEKVQETEHIGTIYKNDIIGFYRSYNLKAYIFILVFIVSFITLLFIIFLLAVFAKAIGSIVIAVLNTFNILEFDEKLSYNICTYSLIPAYIIWNIVMLYGIFAGMRNDFVEISKNGYYNIARLLPIVIYGIYLIGFSLKYKYRKIEEVENNESK